MRRRWFLLVQFQTAAEFVVVDVEVLRDDAPVEGLRQGDFRVFEDGREQPVTGFGKDDQELEVILLVDVSDSTRLIQESVQRSAMRAMNALQFRDRVGVVLFANDSTLAAAPTWDRLAILRELAALPLPEGGTEFNRNLVLTARYLAQSARPGARRAIVMLTDNLGTRSIDNTKTRAELWEADVILSGLLFPNSAYRAGAGDIRPFADDTGGDVMKYDGTAAQLEALFRNLRRRYTLLYRKPAGVPGATRKIRVELTAEAKARAGNVRIRSRRGYIAR